MLEISYISDEDRERLVVLTERLAAVPSFEKKLYADQIAEIHARRKLLKDCSFEEASKLKKQLYDKYRQLVGINKVDLVLIYQNMIMTVEQVISYKKEEFKKEEVDRSKAKRETAKQKLRDRKKQTDNASPEDQSISEWNTSIDFTDF